MRTSVSLAALVWALPALASAETSAEGSTVNEVVVTASRRAERLMEAPLAVQSFDGARLEAQGIRDIGEIVNLVPGATVVGNHNPVSSVYHMRGTGAFDVAGDAGVGYYIDEVAFGVPNNQQAPPSRMFDLERVEVLRGPQGTLWGQGSLGGTIRFITKAPNLDRFGGLAEATVNTVADGDEGYAMDAVLNVPIIPGKLAVRLYGGYERIAGWAEPWREPAREDVNRSLIRNVRAKLLWKPTDDLSVTYTHWVIRTDTDFGTLLVLDPVTRKPTNTFVRQDPNRPAGAYGKEKFSSLTISGDLGFASFESSTGYMEIDSDWTQALESLPATPLTVVRNHFDLGSALNQEFRLVSPGDRKFKWIAGAYYSKADTVNSGTGRLALQVESYAVFGEASYDLLDGKLIPLVGLRYFHDDREGETRTLAGVLTSRPSGTASHVSPRFNLSYKPRPGHMYYINIANGFRPGPVQSQAVVDTLKANGVVNARTVLDPAEAWSYELGGKWTLFDGAVELEANVFRMAFDNIQRLGIYGTAFGVSEAGGGRAQGVEFGVSYRPPTIEGLTLQASGQWNDNKFTSRDNGSRVTVGAQLPGTPDYDYTLRANYAWAISSEFDGAASVTFTQRGSQSSLGSSGVYNKGDEITDLGARFTLTKGDIELTVFGANLLDERGPTYPLTFVSNPVVGGAPVPSGFSYFPRRYGVTLRTSF